VTTVLHGRNYAEERTPHAEEVTSWQDPVIPVARKVPEWF
jgi:hypothetical protein